MYVGYDGRWPKGFNEFLTSTFDNERDRAYSVAIKHPRNDSSDIRKKFKWAQLAIRKVHLPRI
jgi:hypothetical protein